MVMAKNAIIAEILSIRAGVRAQGAVKVGAASLTLGIVQLYTAEKAGRGDMGTRSASEP